jgi:NAD(P)-dependent dehydrogenase (short-subunit alcohol dehydrogenase family)
MSKKLQGQVAVVTGASKGIGAAIAEHLAAAGAAVVVNYASSRAGAEAVVKRIQQTGGKAVAVQADVSRLEDIRPLFAETKKVFGKLDILVNNAGIYEIAGSDFQKQVEVQTPLGRIGQPHDIAPAAVFLASAESAWTTGESLYISGGVR